MVLSDVARQQKDAEKRQVLVLISGGCTTSEGDRKVETSTVTAALVGAIWHHMTPNISQ